ncbi:hypothetical protein [Amycolatopsis vastitatis]|uniref:Uncharacterized protein n=1 Tax=Amycolatopsis vastitatis TaxID=1905142 RepID=A0A229SL97_9PSEU|nr:hypothetical protein [Amycolatopsis vastitatis]OXM59560.1 hypothetical protein CF165_47005 [Amycolatopsis vastitatis]
MTTREQRIFAAVFALTGELDGSWGLATARWVRSDVVPYLGLLLVGPAGEILRIHEVHGDGPWAYCLEPILPEDEDRYATGWNGQERGLDRNREDPDGWSGPQERRPHDVTIRVRAPVGEAAEFIEKNVLPDYRYWSARIHARNTRRRERLQKDLTMAADMAHHFGGPVNLAPPTYNDKTTCKLPDGRSEIDLYTASPRVEMRFVLHRDHATAIAPDLARLLGFIPA